MSPTSSHFDQDCGCHIQAGSHSTAEDTGILQQQQISQQLY